MATLGKQLMELIEHEPLCIAASGRHAGLSAEQEHCLRLMWETVAEDKINDVLRGHIAKFSKEELYDQCMPQAKEPEKEGKEG